MCRSHRNPRPAAAAASSFFPLSAAELGAAAVGWGAALAGEVVASAVVALSWEQALRVKAVAVAASRAAKRVLFIPPP